MLVRPRLKLAHEGVRRIVRLIVPAVLGVSVAQVNLLVDTQFASYLATGSISWLYYSDRLMEFPLGVFGIALATVMLPSLVARHAETMRPDSRRRSTGPAARSGDRGACRSRPVALLAVPIRSLPYSSTANSGRMRSGCRRSASPAYASGLAAFVAVKVLAAGFHAPPGDAHPGTHRGDRDGRERRVQLLLIGPLAHAGLALASSLAAWLNAARCCLKSLRGGGVLSPATRLDEATRPSWLSPRPH